MNFPSLDMPQAIRAAVPGFFLGLCYYILSRAGFFPAVDEVVTTIQGTIGFIFIGFLFDILGAYKIHPTYRHVRRHFFLNLSALQPENASSTQDKIVTGEHLREAILYQNDANRQANLKTEHAIWIALYHVHILSLMVAFAIILFQLKLRKLGDLTADTSIRYVLVAIAAFSIVTLIAAWKRNQSYNEKILRSGKELKRQKKRIK